MDVTWTLLSILATLLIYVYYYLVRQMKYWEEKGVVQVPPLPIIGNLLKVITFQKSMGEIYKDAYLKYPNQKYVGIYELAKPCLIVRDPKLIEQIMVKDFQYFVDHPKFGEENGLFSHGLFNMRGMKWRVMRSKISPAFTSGKLKFMFNDMISCADELVEAIDRNVNTDYELKKDFGDFTMGVIASTVFGIQIKDQHAKEMFAKMGNSIFETSAWKFLQTFMILQAPKLAKFFNLSLMSNEATSYFHGLITNTLNQRSKSGIQRNDYVQQLLKLKEKGAIEVQANDEEDDYLGLNDKPVMDNIEITDDLLTGQAFQFLSAGFDPLYLNMILVMFDLASNPKVQELARKQVKTALEKHGGYTYEAIREMTYLEQCVQETMRLHPLVGFLMRECAKPYKIEGDLEIETGQKIIIPLNALHLDPKHYPDPDVYKPERLPPNSNRNNFTYMPFGDGPRMCIGLRFALVETKIGLAKILDNFKFTLSDKTKVPFEINKQSFILFPTSKILFNMNRIQK